VFQEKVGSETIRVDLQREKCEVVQAISVTLTIAGQFGRFPRPIPMVG
jgi:hypothetical protein